MHRKSFVITCKAGMIDEYIRRHNPIWEELKVALKSCGVLNYSIFHRPNSNELFGYFEVSDVLLFERLSSYEVCQKWWLHMTEVLICEDAFSLKGREEDLTEIFHLA